MMRKKTKRGAHLVPKKSVYFIQCGHERGPIKIGYASDVGSRLSKLQNGCPYPLTLLASFFTEDAEALEYKIHARFAAQRMRGEWFEWSEDLVSVIDLIMGEVMKMAPTLTGPLPPPIPEQPKTIAPVLRLVR